LKNIIIPSNTPISCPNIYLTSFNQNIDAPLVGENNEVYGLPIDNKFLVVHLVNSVKALQNKNEKLRLKKEELEIRVELLEQQILNVLSRFT
jgi:hypothetical protein